MTLTINNLAEYVKREPEIDELFAMRLLTYFMKIEKRRRNIYITDTFTEDVFRKLRLVTVQNYIVARFLLCFAPLARRRFYGLQCRRLAAYLNKIKA